VALSGLELKSHGITKKVKGGKDTARGSGRSVGLSSWSVTIGITIKESGHLFSKAESLFELKKEKGSPERYRITPG